MGGINGEGVTVGEISKDIKVQKFIEDLTEVCKKHGERFSVNKITIKALLRDAEGEIEMIGEHNNFKSIFINIEPSVTSYVINAELDYDTFKSPQKKEG